jgi:hypothetical protein
MIVIGQDKPATRTQGPSHRPNHSQRVSNVLEQVAGVHHVERTPFFLSKGKIEGVAGPELDQVGFSGHVSLPTCLFELTGVTLDSNDAPARTGRPGHGSRELTDPASDVQDQLASSEVQRAQGGVVEKVI